MLGRGMEFLRSAAEWRDLRFPLRWLRLLEQPAYRSLLDLYVLGIPHRVDCMAYGSENHAALAEVVGPPGDRLRSQVFKLQAVDVLRLQDDVFGVFVVGDVMLLIVHYERAHPFRDRVLVV